MPELRVGDFLTRRKEVVQIEDDRDYRQVTISLNHGGVRLRGVKAGAEIGTKRQYLTRASDFILSRIDARNAAFGIVPDELDGAVITNDFWSFEIDREQVDPNYFYLLSQTDAFLDACVRSSTGTTNRQRIQAEFFLDYVFSVPAPADQVQAVERYRSVRGPLNTITAALDRQAADLDALRQRVLDDAVRGRLTQRDPADPPAEALLAVFEREKQRLYRAKEIRKPKSIPPVLPDQRPFELPEGWAWARVDSVAQQIVDCLHKTPRFEPNKTDFACIDTTCLDYGTVVRSKMRYVSEATYREWIKRLKPAEGDVLFSREGQIGLAALVPADLEVCIGQRTMLFRLHEEVTPDYFLTVMLSPLIVSQWEPSVTGTASPHVNISSIRRFLFPLPPPVEQDRIVERVGALLALCDRLAEKLAAARADAERLTQTVLADALAT